MNICEYCGKGLSTKTNLKTHQNTAKYCLKIQGKIVKAKYTCKGCDKTFTLHHHHDQHIKKCIKYDITGYKRKIKRLKEKLKEKDSEIRRLEKLQAANEAEIKVYKQVADKPRTLNQLNQQNNYIHPKLVNIPIDNIQPFTLEHVRKRIKNGEYSYEMFKNGVQGLTEFVSDMIVRNGVIEEGLMEQEIEENEGTYSDDEGIIDYGENHQERNYVCTDSSRNRFHRLLKSKEWVSDNGAHFLEKVLNELEPKARDYYHDILDKMKNARTHEENERMSHIQEVTLPIYFGIIRPKSKDRRELFRKLRSEIKTIAAV